MRNHLRFFNLWLQNPTHIGAVVPSGKSLGAAMAAEIDPASAGAVVELGGGTGSITAALLRRGIARGDLVVVEREPSLCEIMRERFPDIRVICGDARELGQLLATAGITHVKAVVSGLPLLSLSKSVEGAILQQCFAVLPPDGFMVQFTYVPRPPVTRSVAVGLNLKAARVGWVLDNFPPASVWVYRREVQEQSGIRRSA
ncbi:MAG: methyltransferase domain-containing protein [Alphaproteobacteria bacterium]|nr:methyltransferase domain-containing protein [Alphaproteobacteria bacterium]